MKKDIIIGGKTIPMSASALTPWTYKQLFGEDLIKAIQHLQVTAENGELDPELVVKMSYVMAREANKEIEPLEEWLGQFEMFDLYEAFNDIITLWALNEKQNSTPRKK